MKASDLVVGIAHAMKFLSTDEEAGKIFKRLDIVNEGDFTGAQDVLRELYKRFRILEKK